MHQLDKVWITLGFKVALKRKIHMDVPDKPGWLGFHDVNIIPQENGFSDVMCDEDDREMEF
jgi:hypothetical protein